jgi:Cu/Ag efflux protein CusF
MNKIVTVVAALALSMPLVSFAQNAPKAVAVTANAPGQAAVSEGIQVQGKIKSVDKKARSVVIVGAAGNEIHMALGDEVRNFDQIRVGDLVTLTYIEALVLELRKVETKALRERVESEQAVRAKPGEKPAGAVERTVRVIADVVAVNPKAKTVTLRGPKRTVELAVNDVERFKEIKVGDQVEATYTEAVALEVTAAKKK